MTRLYENSKVKKVLAWLLLVSTVLSLFINSTTETVNADSNSRRQTSINLAAGVGFGDISNFDDIDDVSLQTIAIYLSNFYLPFITILDGDYTKEGAEDSGNTQHVKAMKDALIRNCGFNKSVAEYLVGYVLNQSLASCKAMYMKTSELKSCFDATEYITGRSFLGFSNGGVYNDRNPGTEVSSANNRGSLTYWSDSSIYYIKEETKKGGLFTAAQYGDWNYIDVAGTVVVNGTEYTPISYAIFLGVMMNLYIAYNSTQQITQTYKLGDIKFYILQANGESGGLSPTPVFSNSDACLGMLLQAMQYCDLANGFGSGFSSISSPDIESLKDPELSQYALAVCPNMYVNWEGSIILDNGVYRTVVLPGCMNPHMIQSVSTPSYTNTSWSAYPNLINVTSLSSIVSDYTVPSGDTSKRYAVSFSSSYVLNYRVMIGSDSYNFDQSWLPWAGWGDNQGIYDLLSSVSYVGVVGRSGADKARFPVLTSKLMSTGSIYGFYQSSGDKSFSTTNYIGYGSSHGRNIIWYDSFTPINSETTLSSLFKPQDVTDSTFISTLKGYDLDTYAQFRNIKTQGHSLTYPKSTQKLFQGIYLTYCFGAFNSTYAKYESQDVNIAQIKLNLSDFPKGNVDLEWASIQQDQLQNEVMSFVYYLLHPTEGIGYVTKLFKNKVSGILLGWHEDIVGATSSNSATGMTKYLGTSSYTTMPNLNDVSWVSGILAIYNNIVVYLIILMCLILLCYVLTGSMTIQRGIVGVILFGICAFLPPFAINAAVNTINTTSDTIFSKKFDFWAICQMQTFLEQYESAMEAQGSGDFSSYAAFVINTQKSDLSMASSDDDASAASFSGAKLKWMAPKKYNSLASIVSAVNEGTSMGNSSANFLKNSLLSMVAKSTSGETYLEDSESLYLYRDYADIFKYAHTSYNIMSTFNYGGDLGSSSKTTWTMNTIPVAMHTNGSLAASTFGKAWSGIPNTDEIYQFIETGILHTFDTTAKSETSSLAHVAKGYLYNTIDYTPSTTAKTYFYAKGATSGGRPTRNTLSVSYLANYTYTYRAVKFGYNRLMEVVNGTHSADVGDPSSSYYNFGLPKATKDSTTLLGSYLWGYQEIIGLETETLPPTETTQITAIYKNLSDVFYGLYSESPFYFFNANIRDQAMATSLASGDNYSYDFNNLTRGRTSGANGDMNHIAKMFLQNNQEYFFNLTTFAGDGYGELRDFTNMHDFFYFVIPYLRDGTELARLYDDVFGLYVDDDCSLIVNADGSCVYDGQSFKNLSELKDILTNAGGKYTQEELYKLWHTYNTYTILSAYSPWIDTMLDCDYAKSEIITVMGDKFRVSDPLNPRTYYETDASGNLTAGRYMIFSKSEMNAMGLTTADLTEVERKIIQFQDNVYSETLNLMNYYTFSDEVLIQAYAMLQTFEFNKLFSQTTMLGTSYVMYPQGYELKAFSYDAYLRMIVAGSSGESLMFNGDSGNVSIYERVMKNTSMFFGIFLLLNDVLAVYVIPGLKIFFLVTIFFCSVLILIGAVVKMEMNILSVLWKSLFAPLLSFSAVCIGLSLIVSMFMSSGATGVATSEFTINLGDPTSAIIVMIILNVLVVVLMFKICKKCFRDLITYAKAVFDNIGSTVVGAVGAVAAGVAGGRAMDKFGSADGSGSGSGVSRTAKQRGADNDPKSGRRGIGIGGGLAAGAAGAALGAAALNANRDNLSEHEKKQLDARKKRDDDMVGMNKYDKKAYQGQNARQDKAQDKADRLRTLADNAGTGRRRERLEKANARAQRKANTAAIKADNIKKYGSGVRGRFENLKTTLGVGDRQTRIGDLSLNTQESVKDAKDRVRQLREKAKAEKSGKVEANPTTSQNKPNYNPAPRGKVTNINDYTGGKKGSSPVRTNKAKNNNKKPKDFLPPMQKNQRRAKKSS